MKKFIGIICVLLMVLLSDLVVDQDTGIVYIRYINRDGSSTYRPHYSSNGFLYQYVDGKFIEMKERN